MNEMNEKPDYESETIFNGQGLGNEGTNNNGRYYTSSAMYTWRWHKFLCYFLLWFTAVLNIYNLLKLYVTEEGESTRLVYRILGLNWFIVFNTVVTIVLSIFAVVTAVRLLGMKSGAPALIKAMYIANAVIKLFSIIFYRSVGLLISVSDLLAFAISIAIAICNVVYYNKRDRFFDR